jgi:class 3 adenylate cyclase
MAEFGLGMLDAVERYNRAGRLQLSVRVGMHSGAVVAGIIGKHKFIYDIWGDTVNVASRLESHGVAGRIQVSDVTAAALAGRYELEPRGTIELRGRGPMLAFLLGVRGT